MPLSDIQGRFTQNKDIALGLSTSYELLLKGVPTIGGFTFLIDTAKNTNFGTNNPAIVFNTENIYINLTNNLVQGNAAALANFNALSNNGATLLAKITAIYNAIVPAALQTDAGRAFITRPEGITFYQQTAAERGVAGDAGAAIVALASLTSIVVRENASTPGLGKNAADFYASVLGGTATLPENGTVFTPLVDADGVPGPNGVTPPPVTSTTLTLNPDTVTATNFSAPLLTSGGGTQVQSLTSADALTGTGAAVLNAQLNGNPTPVNPTVSAVPTINLTAQTAASTYDASKTTGATRFNNVDSLTSLTVTNIVAAATVGVTNSAANADSAFLFANTLVAGAADTATVVVNNVGRGATVNTGIDINVAGVTAGGFETIALQSTGAASRFDSLTSTQGGQNILRTINVTGDQDVRIDTALTAVTTVNAATFTGALRVTLDPTQDVAVTGGTGADFFNFGAGLTNADAVNGGTGIDTVAVTNLTGLGAGNKITNVEIIRFDGAATGTFDQNNITSVTSIIQNSTAAITVNNFDKTAVADGFARGVTISNTGAVTINVEGATNPGSNQDILNVQVGLTGPAPGSALQTAAGVDAGSLSIPGVEILNVRVNADAAGQTATNLSINDSNPITNLVLTGGAVNEAFSIDTGTAFGAAGVLVSLDASAFTGNIVRGAGGVGLSGNAGSQIIIGGSGSDVLATGGRGVATTAGDLLTGGAGNDTFVFAAIDSTAAIPNTGVANGAFTAAQLNLFTSISDLNLGGAAAGTSIDKIDLSAVFDFAGPPSVVSGTPLALTGGDFGTAVNNAIQPNPSPLRNIGSAADNLTAKVGLFTYNGETFLIGNEASSGDSYEGGNAIIIRVTGFTGTLDAGDLIF